MERISKKPTPDCPLCGWSRKDHPMATHEWATKTGECAGEDREPCLLRQLAAANEKLTESARLATESAQLADGLARDLAAANERAGRLEEALEWYAKPNWEPQRGPDGEPCGCPAWEDNGAIARKALEVPDAL
mgnify:CR=1 FL=1